MEISILYLAILFAASLVTSLISAVSGMGGGIVLLAVMTFFFSPTSLIPIHGLIQLISNSSRAWYLKKHIHVPLFLWFLLGLPFGTLLAIAILARFEVANLITVLLLILILYTVFRPKNLPELKIPIWSFSLVGFFVGLFGPLIGSTGPMMAPFFLRDDLNRKQIVASKASVQLIGHLIKIPTFLYLGFSYVDYSISTGVMIGGVLIGTHYGVKLLDGLKENTFRWLFRIALLGAALRLSYQLVFAS